MSVVSCRLSVVGCQLSVVSCRGSESCRWAVLGSQPSCLMSSHGFVPRALGLWWNGNLTQRRKDTGTQRRHRSGRRATGNRQQAAGSRPNGEITAGFLILHSCRFCLPCVPASLRLGVKIFLPAGIPGSFMRQFLRFLRIQTKSGVFQTTKASQLYTRTELIHYDQEIQSSLTTFPNQQTRHQPPYLLKLPHITGTSRIMVPLSHDAASANSRTGRCKRHTL